MESKITFRDLFSQIRAVQKSGQTYAEVGPNTWKIILDTVHIEDAKDGWMLGVHLVKSDVPEGKIWPQYLKE